MPRPNAVGLRDIGIERQRAVGSLDAILLSGRERKKENALDQRHQAPGAGIFWIELDSAASDAGNEFQLLDVAPIAGDPVFSRQQVVIVGVDILRPAPLYCPFLLRKQLDFQSVDDRLRNLVLDRKNVGEIAVVAFGPDVIARGPIDQLRRYANAASCLADAPF